MHELTPLNVRMLLGSGINVARQRPNLPHRSTLSYVIQKAGSPIKIVEFKNIGSAGFTQLIFVRTVIKNYCTVEWPVVVPKLKVPCIQWESI